jgi:streptomycin 6-kinase
MGSGAGPEIDAEVRRRLGRRYGLAVGHWLDALPRLLQDIAERWHLDLGPLVRRGTVSVVVRCRAPGDARVILKVSPDHARITAEARALAEWRTDSVPRLLASDTDRGVLLMEQIEPGTALDESGHVPSAAASAALLAGLHHEPAPGSLFTPLQDRITSLFRAGEANYARRPDLQAVIPRSSYERGRRAALALAAETSGRVTLHGDLTPANILDGGARGVVAIDPAPCAGDPAFDAVDLLLWQADDLATLTARVHDLADRLDLPPERLLRWCAAFGAMVALEDAEAADPHEPLSARTRMLIELSSSVS